MENNEVKNTAPVEQQNNTIRRGAPSKSGFNLISILGEILLLIKNPLGIGKVVDEKYYYFQSSAILTAVIAVGTMLIGLLMSIINGLFLRTGMGVSFSLANLRTVPFVRLIFIDLVKYFLVIVVITVLYFIVSKLFKKELDFAKTLAYTSFSIIPLYITSSLIYNFIVLLSPKLFYIGVATLIAALFLSINLLYSYVNHALDLEFNQKIYFNSIVFLILVLLITILFRVSYAQLFSLIDYSMSYGI